jgi:hypothetical protein
VLDKALVVPIRARLLENKNDSVDLTFSNAVVNGPVDPKCSDRDVANLALGAHVRDGRAMGEVARPERRRHRVYVTRNTEITSATASASQFATAARETSFRATSRSGASCTAG